MGIALKYVGRTVDGDPKEFYPGLPASDLEVGTDEEADRLVASGLYERAGAPKSLTVAQLTARATGLGIELASKATKAEILEAIEQAEAAAVEAAAASDETPAPTEAEASSEGETPEENG